MKNCILTLFASSLVVFAFGQFKPQGTFIGIEPIKGWEDSLGNESVYYDPANPKHKWYHLSIMSFKGDSVFLVQSPIAIFKTDTIFSKSDGGFFFYTGTIQKYQGKMFAYLILKSCDYCSDWFSEFQPPIIVKVEDTLQTIETETDPDISYPITTSRVDTKMMIIGKSNAVNSIIVDKNIYRKQKRK